MLKYNKMNQSKKAFTLIELIIVVVIIGILALIAIPKYFANVAKARKNQVYANLATINQAAMAYYTVYGIWPAAYTYPITVILDGDTVCNVTNPDPSVTSWWYDHTAAYDACISRGGYGSAAWKQPGSTCYYALCANGYTYQTCTP